MGVTVRQKVKGKGNPWWVFISGNGKRTSRKVGDKKAADAVASKIRAKLQLGEFGFEQKKKRIPLFKDYAQGFMETYSAMNHKASTRDSYKSILDNHILPRFGGVSIDRITKKDVKDFLTEKLQTGLALNSVRNIKRYFSTIMAEAVDDEIISDNPVLKTGKILKRKREETEGINPFSWEEKRIFEEAMKEQYHHHYPLFLTALLTGMRIGEIMALQPGDLLRKRIFYKCLEKAGLRRIRLHDLRHTYATLRIMKGDNIPDVSKQLGHYSPKLTLDIYAHWMPGSKKAELDELDLIDEPERKGLSIGNVGSSKMV